ncbi:pseudouridine synthase [Dentipellis sp. KUC8613]|nr:pseudouridine synthase [Dentipellis sp. KUC8613]
MQPALSDGLALAVNRIRRASGLWAHQVLYLDRAVLVLNKPPGLVSQPTSADAPGPRSTPPPKRSDFDKLLRALKRHLQLDDLYPVHRLDKSTTGALLLARTKSAAQQLSQQFQSRTIGKSYLALVRGGAKTFPEPRGSIDSFLRVNDGRVSLSTVDAPGSKPAQTDWELLATSRKAPLSLLRLHLRTGLKHQLRIHTALTLKAPVLGDVLYSTAAPAPQISALTQIPHDRMFLHASHVSFFRYRKDGPSKRFRLGITAPLPDDFVRVCRDVGIPLDQDVVRGGVYVDGVRVPDGAVPEVDGLWIAKPPETET